MFKGAECRLRALYFVQDCGNRGAVAVQTADVQVQLGIRAPHDPLAFVFGTAGTDRGGCARLLKGFRYA